MPVCCADNAEDRKGRSPAFETLVVRKLGAPPPRDALGRWPVPLADAALVWTAGPVIGVIGAGDAGRIGHNSSTYPISLNRQHASPGLDSLDSLLGRGLAESANEYRDAVNGKPVWRRLEHSIDLELVFDDKLLSAHGEQRARRGAHHVLGHAAEHELAQAAAPVGGHDQQVGLDLLGIGGHSLGNPALLASSLSINS